VGPSDTGKSFAACLKLHAVCGNTSKAQTALVRKAYNSLVGTIVQTFIKIVRPTERGIQVFGGEKPERFIYPNGSCVWLGGMDNPNRVLSSERDAIYVCQAEELSLDDWEMLATRCSGRGAVVAHAQLFGDLNPAGARHWLRQRAEQGRMALYNSCHRDNPTLYDAAGQFLDTPNARARMAALENLTGVRRKRLLEGIWATAEGAVYDMFDSNVGGPHVRARARSEMRRFFLAIDDGFTNPAVVLDVGEDPDKRWHVFREFYQTGQLRETVVRQAKAWHDEFMRSEVAVDSAVPELVTSLEALGLPARGGKGKIEDGIRTIQDRLAVQADGLARLTVDPSCVNTINEFESYVMKPGTDVPMKENDHAMDSLRYLADVLGEDSGAWDAEAVRASALGASTAGRRVFVPRRFTPRFTR